MGGISRAVVPLLAGLLPAGAFAGCQDTEEARDAPPPEAAPERIGAGDGVREVAERFREALESADSATVLELLHEDVRVYEGGYAETLEEYRSDHLPVDIEFAEAVEAETRRDEVVPGEDLALYLREYSVSGTFQDQDVEAEGTETLGMVPTGEGWRIRHIHWSSR